MSLLQSRKIAVKFGSGGAGKRLEKGALPSQSEQMHLGALARQRRACTIAVVETRHTLFAGRDGAAMDRDIRKFNRG